MYFCLHVYINAHINACALIYLFVYLFVDFVLIDLLHRLNISFTLPTVNYFLLLQEVAGILANYWDVTEETYIDGCKIVFRYVRAEREIIIRYYYQVR